MIDKKRLVYKHDSSENIEEILRIIDIPWIVEKQKENKKVIDNYLLNL